MKSEKLKLQITADIKKEGREAPPISLPEIIHSENRHPEHDKNHAGNPIESLSRGLVRKHGGNLRENERADNAYDKRQHIRRSAYREVADGSGQSCRTHDEHACPDGCLGARTRARRVRTRSIIIPPPAPMNPQMEAYHRAADDRANGFLLRGRALESLFRLDDRLYDELDAEQESHEH